MGHARQTWTATSAALAVALLAATATPTQAAGLLVADGGLGGVLEVEEHAVDVTVNNGIAVTTVTQVFRNTEDRQVEALYTFPVPKGASVADFSMWIGGREMTGEVVEAKRAREIYESYKQRNIDPGLLEQVDFKTFEMRIFPIAAQAEQRVRITYYQELDFDRDWATYVYPLATETRSSVDSRTRGKFALTLNVASEVPIAKIESPSHGDDFALVQHTPNYVQASLETTGGDLNRDIVLAYQLSRPVTGIDVVASKERSEDGYFLLTLTAGDELAATEGGMDYVFVLDVSGSMNHDGKLSLSRGSLDAFIHALGEEDRFDVLTFNVAANPLFRELRGASPQAMDEASVFLDAQGAKGGTVLEPAMRLAYRYKDPDRALNVVLLSDGMTEQQERETLLRLVGERPGATRVFTIGVGNEVNRPLLAQMAEDAGGLAAFLSRGDDFERQAAAFRRKLLRPAMSNVEITADGGELFDIEPKRLPSLFHGMPVRMYGRYGKAESVQLTLTGDIGGERVEKTFDIALPRAEENPEIERMWAWHRVQRLSRETSGSAREAAIAETIRLGEAYSIVTPYTSFLVLENDAEFQRWKIERRNVLRLERDRGAQQLVREKLAALRNQATDQLGPSPRTETVGGGAPDAAPPDRRSMAPSHQVVPTSTRRPPGNSGGGALDPFGVGIVLALGSLSLAAIRRRREERS